MEGEDIFVQGGEGRLLGEATFDLQSTLGKGGGQGPRSPRCRVPVEPGDYAWEAGGRREDERWWVQVMSWSCDEEFEGDSKCKGSQWSVLRK